MPIRNPEGGGNLFNSNRNTTRGGIPVVDAGGTTVQQFLEAYFFPAEGPSISLSATPGQSYRQIGAPISSVDLTANYAETTNPVTTVEILKGVSVIDTDASPTNPTGTLTHSDTSGISTTTSYTATATDGTFTTTSNTVTFNFVYPFYYGVGAQGLSGSSIQALTTLIVPKQNNTTTTSPTVQVYYYSYPQAYGVLTSILDTNGFETLPDYILRTVTLTMLDSSSQIYNVYEYKNLTTQVNFNNTYKF